MPSTPPDATELTRAFDLGAPLAPAEWMSSGCGGHNQLWRLMPSRGNWPIKEVGRELGPDPDDTLALELAAYASGVRMPRPVPTTADRCFAALGGRRIAVTNGWTPAPCRGTGMHQQLLWPVGGLLARLH